MKKLLILILLLSQGSFLSAEILSDKYYIGEMPSSQAIGRGGAFVAVGGSAYAAFWNPAGLSLLENNKLGISANIYSETSLDVAILNKKYPLQGQKINFISIVAPQAGVYWRPLVNRVDKSTGTSNGVDYTEKIDVKISVFGLTIAVPHTDEIDFGMNINFIFGTLGLARIKGGIPTATIHYGYGWGLDWGLIYKVSDIFNVGISLLNGPAWIYWDGFGNHALPPILRSGINMQFSELMSVGIDYKKGFYDDSLNDAGIIHLGIEHYLLRNFIIRGGIFGSDFNNHYTTTYTAGIGYRKENYMFDIAFKQFYETKTQVRRFSISGVISF